MRERGIALANLSHHPIIYVSEVNESSLDIRELTYGKVLNNNFILLLFIEFVTSFVADIFFSRYSIYFEFPVYFDSLILS